MERPVDPLTDQLSLAVRGTTLWTEDVTATSISRSAEPLLSTIANAESPAFSPDGRCVAFLRAVSGSQEVFVQCANAGAAELQLTPAPFDVYEIAFLSPRELVMSASRDGSAPEIYRVPFTGNITPLIAAEARYPAVSPDGRRLAFSRFVAGNWNLQLYDFATGNETGISRVPCNQLEAAWELDSKTLLYASDCGRALWFTALARRQVIP